MAPLLGFASLLVLGACDNSATVNFRTGDLVFTVSATSLPLPDALREDGPSGPRIRSVPCGPMGTCPTSAALRVSCEASVCDPEPTAIVLPIGDAVDFDDYSGEFDALLRQVDSIEIREIAYTVGLNTLTVDVGELEIWWGPQGSSAGETRLGVVPPLPGRATPSGSVQLDAMGAAALGDYLVSTSRVVRLFAHTRADLAPGDPFPEGEAQVTVQLAMRVSGPLVH